MTQLCHQLKAHRQQFSLLLLFEFTTLCCILAALSGLTGVTTAFLLMAFTLSLAFNNGLAAIALLTAASLATEFPKLSEAAVATTRQLSTLLIAAALATWHRVRRHSHEQHWRSHANLPAAPHPHAFGDLHLPDRSTSW